MTSKNYFLGYKRRTKIVATLGPASKSPEIIRKMIEKGVNVVRLNFSHGSHEQHSEMLNLVRSEAKRVGRYIAVFQDLGGPKVRIGNLVDGEAFLKEGNIVTLRHYQGESGNSENLYVEAFDPIDVIRPGEKALLGDGQIQLTATKIDRHGVSCIVTAGGMARSRIGIAVPESKLSLPALTEKDFVDVVWGVSNKIDYVALSFVGSAQDILDLRKRIHELKGSIPIIAKIERAGSLDHLQDIIETSDAVMVARGDLGLELPLERVPSAQKLIIETANFSGTPVITATQMLRSMVEDARPTRAEVSDVCTAVRDGTDAVMLSEETAIGKYPVEAVEMLDRIIREAEKEFETGNKKQLKAKDREVVADAVCYAACGAAEKISAAAIIACTLSGYTARLIAKYRPQQQLFGATPEIQTLTRMALVWGIEPVLINVNENSSVEEEVTQSMEVIRDQYGIKPGARTVITAGLRSKKTGTTCLMEIREVPRPE